MKKQYCFKRENDEYVVAPLGGERERVFKIGKDLQFDTKSFYEIFIENETGQIEIELENKCINPDKNEIYVFQTIKDIIDGVSEELNKEFLQNKDKQNSKTA